MVRTSNQQGSKLQDARSLQAIVKRVESLIYPAKRIAADMEELKIETISVTRQPSLKAALEALAVWGKACEDAWNAKMDELGMFHAEKPAEPPAGKEPSAAPSRRGARKSKQS